MRVCLILIKLILIKLLVYHDAVFGREESISRLFVLGVLCKTTLKFQLQKPFLRVFFTDRGKLVLE